MPTFSPSSGTDRRVTRIGARNMIEVAVARAVVRMPTKNSPVVTASRPERRSCSDGLRLTRLRLKLGAMAMPPKTSATTKRTQVTSKVG